MWHYIKHFWKEHTILSLCILSTTTIQSVNFILLEQAFDAVIDFNWTLFIQLTLIRCILWGTFLLFSYLKIIQMSKTKQIVATGIRSDISRRIEQMDYEDFHRREANTYSSWMTNDVTTILNVGFESFYKMLELGIAMITSIITLFFFHWTIVLFSIIVGYVTLQLPKFMQKRVQSASLTLTEEMSAF